MSKLFRRHAKFSFPVTLRDEKKEDLAEALRPYVEHMGLGTHEYTFEIVCALATKGDGVDNLFECIVTSFVPVSAPWMAFSELVKHVENFHTVAMANSLAYRGYKMSEEQVGFFDSMKDNEDQFARMQKAECEMFGLHTEYTEDQKQTDQPVCYNKWLQRRNAKNAASVQRNDVVSPNT